MSDRRRGMKVLLRLAPMLGVGLLAYLLTKMGISTLVENAKAIGWGMLLVIALGGVSHVIKTWAWRLTLLDESRKVSFGRTLGLRLVSEAIGQFGFVGMLGGEAARVSLLGSGVSVAGAISSVALDRTLFILAGAVVTLAGVVGLVFAISVSHAVHIYLAALAVGLLLLLFAGGDCHPPQVAGILRARPCSSLHSVVPKLGSQQRDDSQSGRAAHRRLLPRGAASVLGQRAAQLRMPPSRNSGSLPDHQDAWSPRDIAWRAHSGVADEDDQCGRICQSRQCGYVRGRKHGHRQTYPTDRNPGTAAGAMSTVPWAFLGHHWRNLPPLVFKKAETCRHHS